MITAQLKKMSMKTLLGASKKTTIGDMIKDGRIKTGQVLIKIVGVVTGSRHGSTTYGDYVAFSGDFVAKHDITGEVYQSGELFLDRNTSDQVAAKLAENPDGVEIAVQVAIQIDPDSSVGYCYVTRPLQAVPQVRMAALLAKLDAPTSLPEPVAPAETVDVEDTSAKPKK